MQAKRRPVTTKPAATRQTPLNLDLAPDATAARQAAMLRAEGLNRFLQNPLLSRSKLTLAQIEKITLVEAAEEAAAAARLPLPPATLSELLAMPLRPNWIPEGRARECVLEGTGVLLEHLYPHILHLASVSAPKRKGVNEGDLVSALTAAARAEIARWDPERVSPSRRAKGLGVLGVVEGIKSYLSKKLANGSIERDWLSRAPYDDRTDSLDAPLTDDGGTLADTLVDGGASPADQAAAREQGAAIVAILHRNPSDAARAAERYLIRELGLPARRPRQISAEAKGKLKNLAAGKGLGNCPASMSAILREIETAARILANREAIAAAKMERGEPEYLRLARAAGLR